MKTLQQFLMKKKLSWAKSIEMMKSQRSGIEENKLIEDGKRISIDKIIKQNERINNNLKSQV